MPNLNPNPVQIISEVLRHPKLVNRLPPHFTVHRQPLSAEFIALSTENNLVKKVLKKTLANLQGRMFCAIDYYDNQMLFGFEEPEDLTFFTLMHSADEF
jgi:hypothetical protein